MLMDSWCRFISTLRPASSFTRNLLINLQKFRALDSPNNNISTACPKHRDRQFLRPPKAPRKTYLHTSKWRAQLQISALMSLHDTRRSLLTQQTLEITFLTHLVPMTRGILSSCYSRLNPEPTSTSNPSISYIREVYQDFYKSHPFVVITDTPPQTKQTLGNNQCLIYPTIDPRTNRLIVISCIDNLVKGAAGQAVQNMNLMYQLPEETALESLAVYP